MSIMEVSLYIDTSFASYLPAGSISLLNYANRFMGIPLGVFAVAFSTILLPHFSRIHSYAPRRLSFYLLEASKLVLWVMLPVAIIMGFFGEKIFSTLFLSEKFTMQHVVEAHSILIAFLIGLFFFSLNKVILNVYYAHHNTIFPTIIALVATIVNIGFNFIFMHLWQATGLALATSLSVGILQALLLLLGLKWLFGFKIYIRLFFVFLGRYCLQLAAIFSVFFLIYMYCSKGITWLITYAYMQKWISHPILKFLLDGLGYWLWIGPLCVLVMATLLYSRKFFGVKLYFID
jgi:putative peptidoglycan lipid II flippase